MAKLRKTLGSPTEPAVVALMEGMEGKSKETLTTWAMAYVTEKYLPLVAETPLFCTPNRYDKTPSSTGGR